MRNQILVLGFWTLLELFGLCYARYGNFAFPLDLSVVYTYSRSTEIENQCSPFLSSASVLKPDDSRGRRLVNELSFYHGDWDQEYTGASLMPFDDSRSKRLENEPSPWKLVSFEVTDVNSAHQSKTTVSLSGVLSIGITQNSTFIEEPISTFIMRLGMSALRIDFEGVFFETEENGGEHLVCLLGNSTLPSRKFFDDSTDMMENYFDATYDIEPVISKSDQILLLLRYPRTLNVSSKGIHGEMTSLSKDDSSKFFDKVHISSQLGSFSKYQFSSGNLSSRSCDLYPLHDKMVKDGVIKFSSSEFCRVLKGFQDEVYHIVPNLKLGEKYDQYQNKFGPFLLGKEIEAIGSNYENLRIGMHNIICEEASQGVTKIARVSAVLRLIPGIKESYAAARRTGLSEFTLSVEGTWDSSLGQLCMVGCLGPRFSQCDSQILLDFPSSISINQKNMIFGSISSLRNDTDLDTPFLFGSELYSARYRYNRYIRSYMSYNYTKIKQADAFRERSPPAARLIATVKRSLFRYPSLEEGKSLLHRLAHLSNDLRFGAFVSRETFVQIEVLSLGPLLGPLNLVTYHYDPSAGTQAEFSNSDILNISLILKFTEAPVKVKDPYYKHVLKLHLEGVYDPRVGTLYLVGCRNVLIKNIDIEGGRDCLIDVKIEYSSETIQWLKNPTAKITITSQRNRVDLLHFAPIILQTFMLHDRKHEEAVKFRNIFEGGLQVVLLLVSVVLIWSQLCYMKKNSDLVPYVSLVMLCMQLLVYGSSLIGNREIIIKSRETKYYRDRAYSLQSYQWYLEAMGYMAKLLVLASLVLSARLFRMVIKARAQGGSKFGDVPSDVKVLLISLVVFSVFSLFLLLDYWHLVPSGRNFIPKVVFIIVKFADQVCLSPDYFLVPQVVATRLSKTPVNPLMKAYIRGFVSISILRIFYCSFRDSVDHPIGVR